jgi:hypothetical protein
MLKQIALRHSYILKSAREGTLGVIKSRDLPSHLIQFFFDGLE